MDIQFVPAVIGLIIKDNHVLLIKRIKEPFSNLWSIPGGKIEKHEYVSSAVIREIKEEVGLNCKINKYLGTVSEHVYNEAILERHHIIHVFQLSVIDGMQIDGLRWYCIDSLEQEQNITPSDIAIIKEFLVYKKHKYMNCHLRKIGGNYTLELFNSPCDA